MKNLGMYCIDTPRVQKAMFYAYFIVYMINQINDTGILILFTNAFMVSVSMQYILKRSYLYKNAKMLYMRPRGVKQLEWPYHA